MVAAFEVLVANNAVRNLVREGRTHQLRNVMHSGRAEGMLTLETWLNELVAKEAITFEDAMFHSMFPKEIREHMLRTA